MPFYPNYGYHPKFGLLNFFKGDNCALEDFATQLSQLQTTMKFQLQEAEDYFKTSANKF